jgi:hypothetical protein
MANKLQAYWSWNYTHAPSWNSIRREIDLAEQKTPWHKKDPRVVWRGKIKMAELRKELVRVSEGKNWSDIKPVVINNATDVHTKDVMNLRQFCGYDLLYTSLSAFSVLTAIQIQIYSADRRYFLFWTFEVPPALSLSIDYPSARVAGVPHPSPTRRRPQHQLHPGVRELWKLGGRDGLLPHPR